MNATLADTFGLDEFAYVSWEDQNYVVWWLAPHMEIISDIFTASWRPRQWLEGSPVTLREKPWAQIRDSVFSANTYTDPEWLDHLAATRIFFNLRRFVRRRADEIRRAALAARNAISFAPGGAGYLTARQSFQIESGQRRATRRYRPY